MKVSSLKYLYKWPQEKVSTVFDEYDDMLFDKGHT